MKKRKKKEQKKLKNLEKKKNKVLKNLRRLRKEIDKLTTGYDVLEKLEVDAQQEEESLAKINRQINDLKIKIKKKPKEKKPQLPKKRNKNEVVSVREKLILECGTVDMYDMLVYEERKLTLHHDPPFRLTGHTVFEESFLLTRPNHDWIEHLQRQNRCAYERTMDQIRENKDRLIKMRQMELEATKDNGPKEEQ